MYAKLIGEVFGQKWRIQSSTPYAPRQVDNHLGWFRLPTCQKDEIWGGVSKSGGELKIFKAHYCNGCVWT
jgi:hypothetical protein